MIGTSLNGHVTLLGGHHEEYLSPRLKSNIIAKSTHGQSALQVYQSWGDGHSFECFHKRVPMSDLMPSKGIIGLTLTYNRTTSGFKVES